jgi:DNA polymerase-1
MSRHIIIDADSLVYQATTASLVQVEFAPGQWIMSCDMEEVLSRFKDQVYDIQEKLGGDSVVMTLGDYDNPNWRLSILPTYKENRKATFKPLCFMPLREWIAENHETFIRPTLEGDDCCGILLTRPSYMKGDEKILVSIDKDMKTLPGLHCNLHAAQKTGKWDVFEVTPFEADYNHMTQALTGDSVDGFKGLPGVGPVGAKRILAGLKAPQLWPAVLAAYEEKGLTEEDALVQARVARILRSTDFNFKTREVKLWTP